MRVTGVIILVPGAISFKSLSILFDHDVISGVDAGISALITALSIVSGLLFGNLLINPRRHF